jgi:hypothetical protein
MRYYLIRPDATAGAILYDGVSPYTPPAGFTLMAEPDFLAWRQANPEPAPQVPVPQELPRRQCFRALLQKFGITRAQIRAMLTDEQDLIDFDEALTFRRDNALIATLATALGKTPQEVDEVFILGITFE